MVPVHVRRVFVNSTRNVKMGDEMLEGLNLVGDEGVTAAITGEPGTGKSFYSQVRAANNGGVYYRVPRVLREVGGSRCSVLDFLQGFCKAPGMDIMNPPARKAKCYAAIIDCLTGTGRTVFVDEVQVLHKDFLSILLDMSDVTGCPFILVGEPELRGMMQSHARIWSRTYYAVEFGPISVGDIIFYANEAAGLKLSGEIANILHKSSGGDFRNVRRNLVALAQVINAKGPGKDGAPQITEEMARIAVKVGLSAGMNGGGAGAGLKP